MMGMKKLLIIVIAALSGSYAKAQMVAVNTDLLMDLLATPSGGIELVVGERSTLGLDVMGNYHPWKKNMKMIVVQPEYRYYFSGRPMHKHFIGIGGLAASYDVKLKGKVHNGTGLGIGVVFGYVANLGKRFNIDFHAGFGAIGYKHKEYSIGDNYDSSYTENGELGTNATGYYLLPTRVGVSLTYILK